MRSPVGCLTVTAVLRQNGIVMPAGSDFVAAMKPLQAALGDNDLAKQVFSDANTADRQTRRDHFEARMEYVRQMAERSLETEKSIKELP